MKELDSKKESRFALICIVVYVVVMSICEGITDKIGIQGIVTAPVGIILAGVLYYIISRNNRLQYYGFNSLKNIRYGKVLYLLPFIVLATVNLWRGPVLNCSPFELILYVIFMMAVGFLEETIFRGLLLKSLMHQGTIFAVVISSVTFGMGHIVNLLNGAELLPTLMQLVYAVSIGFMLSAFVVRVKNIIPCILFHGVFNAMSIFSNEAGMSIGFQVFTTIAITAISLSYALYLWYGYDIKNNRNYKENI